MCEYKINDLSVRDDGELTREWAATVVNAKRLGFLFAGGLWFPEVWHDDVGWIRLPQGMSRNAFRQVIAAIDSCKE